MKLGTWGLKGNFQPNQAAEVDGTLGLNRELGEGLTIPQARPEHPDLARNPSH